MASPDTGQQRAKEEASPSTQEAWRGLQGVPRVPSPGPETQTLLIAATFFEAATFI